MFAIALSALAYAVCTLERSNMTLKGCLKSMRLRTLPLSLSGVIAGLGLARCVAPVGWDIIIFLLLTTCFLQVLSNLSNELGDTLHGTDTAERQGMHYAVLDGEMTVAELRALVRYAALGCLVCGALLILFSFGTLCGVEPVIFMLLGIAAIVAAMRYTLGRNPYGYRAKGDLFVFIFFGLVSTVGSYYICSHDICLLRPLLPACAIGCFSIGVLNVNNIRDMKTDARTRTTVALKLGLRGARIYQTVLIALGWLCLVAFSALMTCGHVFPESDTSVIRLFVLRNLLYFATLPLFILHLLAIWTREDRALDPMLPMLVMSTFALSILFVLGLC